MGRSALLAALAAAICVAEGCGGPQIEPDHRRLLQTLRTALSARNAEWLEANAQLIDEARESGELGERSYAALSGIVEQARGGDWAGAERRVKGLMQSQRPTREEQQQARRRHSH